MYLALLHGHEWLKAKVSAEGVAHSIQHTALTLHAPPQTLPQRSISAAAQQEKRSQLAIKLAELAPQWAV